LLRVPIELDQRWWRDSFDFIKKIKEIRKMVDRITKQDKIICPECKGNGFVRVPYHLAKEEIWADCEECNSQGEIIKDPAQTTEELRKKGLM
tara:strand:- start:65 stop:340 length:276 start_codon:yes stop_codon:yes gene_type:complete